MARSGQPVVRCEQFVDLASDLGVRVNDHDEVVADPLEIGHEVRGEDHTRAGVGNDRDYTL